MKKVFFSGCLDVLVISINAGADAAKTEAHLFTKTRQAKSMCTKTAKNMRIDILKLGEC